MIILLFEKIVDVQGYNNAMTHHSRLVDGLILFMLFCLVVTPPLLGGMVYAHKAEQVEEDGDYLQASIYYELSANRLIWKDDLWADAGQAAQLAGNAADAISYFGKAQTLSPSQKLSLGDAYWQSGLYPEAMGVWQGMLESGTELVGVYQRLTQAYLREKEYKAAITSLQSWIKLEPEEAGTHYQLALLLAATLPDQALPELMQAISLDPALDDPAQVLRTSLNRALLQDDRAYQYLEAGRGLASLGEWELAAEAFRNALIVDPTYAEAAAWLGEAQYQLGNDGYPYLELALELDANLPVGRIFIGLFWQRAGNSARALQEYIRATELDPQNPAWQILAGNASARTGDVNAALDYFKRAVSLAPAEVEYRQTLVEFCIQYNVEIVETGLPAALELMALSPSDWRAWDVLGQVELANGDLAEAEKLLLKALEMSPQEGAIHLHLGVLYLQKNDPISAYDHLIKVRNTDPGGVYQSQADRLLERYFP